MSALTGIRTNPSKGSNPRLRIYQRKVKAGVVIYQGAAVGVDISTGFAEPMNGTNANLVAYGVADFTADGDGVVGPTQVTIRPGVYPMFSSGLAFTDEGVQAYATSDQDFSTSSNSGARPLLGVVEYVESATIGWIAIEPPSAHELEAEAGIGANLAVQKRTVTVGHADLTEPADNTPQAINIGAVLPANARIVGCDFRSYTAFSGGGVSALTCDIGTSDDIDAIVDGADLFAAAVDGGPATMPQGIRPNKTFATAGAQLIATFLTDSGHDLEDLTAGSIVIDVLFVELA